MPALIKSVQRKLLKEAIAKRIDHLIRLGQPFNASNIWDERVRAATNALREDDLPPTVLRHSDLNLSKLQYANLTFNQTLRYERYRGKLWCRYDRGLNSFESVDRNRVYYPSNDEARWHIKEQEVLVPHTRVNDRAWLEPPVIHDKQLKESAPAEPARTISLHLLNRDELLAVAQGLRQTAQINADIATGLAGLADRLVNLLEKGGE